MAGHSHDEHHFSEQKPVAFTVPFILAAVVILIVVLLLSLCDPKPHGAHQGHENPAHSNFEGAVHNPNAVEGQENTKGDHATTTTGDTSHVESGVVAPAEGHGH